MIFEEKKITLKDGRSAALKDNYLEQLFYEIDGVAEIVKDKNVRCVYIGGGTPTALDGNEFEMLLGKIDSVFPKRAEYTVEAGRPDTIDDKKLLSMKSHGVTRISVNAQTTNDDTLKLIGRDYSNELYYEIFNKARDFGFDNINSDIILGLPGEDLQIMMHTLEDVLSLSPENITIHTLAIKNSSYFADMAGLEYPDSKVVACAVSEAYKRLTAAEYVPYYMYRQKYMSGNLENTGYSKKGHICAYNIDNMEETVSVLALGSGGISKRIFAEENRIERACNVKDVVNYCERTDEMLRRKRELFY